MRVRNAGRGGSATEEPPAVEQIAAQEGAIPAPSPGVIQTDDRTLPKGKKDLPFFELLFSFSGREWEDRLVYLYRKEPAIQKADAKDSKYIGKYSHAFDEDFVKQEHGGGAYLVMLKKASTSFVERTYQFKIEGPAKLSADQVLRDGKVEGPAAAAAGGAHNDPGLVALLSKLIEDLKTRGGTDEASMVSALSIMKKGMESAIDTISAAAKDKTTSLTGSSVMDELFKTMIANMSKPKDEMATAITILKLLKENQPAAAENPAGAGLGGLIGQIKSIMELAKTMGFKLPEPAAAAAEASGGAGDWKSAVVAVLPQALQQFAGILSQMQQNEATRFDRAVRLHQMNNPAQGQTVPGPTPPGPGTVLPPSAPAPPPPAQSGLPANFAPAAPAPPPSNVVAFPPPPPAYNGDQSPNLDWVCANVAHCFNEGDDGTSVAYHLKRLYPDHIGTLRLYLADTSIMQAFASGHPILAPLTQEEGWQEFLDDFVAEMASDGDEEDDSEEIEHEEIPDPPKPA